MDSSTPLVCPLFPNIYAHLWVYMCSVISPTSQIRAEVQMTSGHSFSEVPRCERGDRPSNAFDIYWSSTDREITVLVSHYHQRFRAYLIDKDRGCCKCGSLESRFFENAPVRTLATAHPCHLIIFTKAEALRYFKATIFLPVTSQSP